MTSRVSNFCNATALAVFWLASSGHAVAGVSAEEAAALGNTLMPLGGEMAANADGSIPAWTGGMADPNYNKNGGRRDDLFVGDKPLYSVTAADKDKYKSLLTAGTAMMLEKYPDFRMDIYPTVRAAAAPKWIYENTKKNAVNASIIEGPSGPMPQGAFGGIPFPIPKTGTELIWNHLLAWRGVSVNFDFHNWLVTANGKRVFELDGRGQEVWPYYYENSNLQEFIAPTGNNGLYTKYVLKNAGPPIRAGEAILQTNYLDSAKDTSWLYLTGQRRVRMLPNACCDTPHPAAAGLLSYDEIYAFYGRMDRFDWKLVGKQELFVPYNENQLMAAKDLDLLKDHFLDPDLVRWEKHRVWVVDATLKSGQRHVAPKGRYYFDEDTFQILLVDRWDARDQLWKLIWQLPFAAPDMPAEVSHTFGYYDLVSQTWFAVALYNEFAAQRPQTPRPSEDTFTPEALAGEGIR